MTARARSPRSDAEHAAALARDRGRGRRLVLLVIVSDSLSAYRDLQLAYGGYYFCVLAGLTVLAGSSGQISLGQGALMAVGAYTCGKLDASLTAGPWFPSWRRP